MDNKRIAVVLISAQKGIIYNANPFEICISINDPRGVVKDIYKLPSVIVI